jgi:two-component system, NtrC family, sensor histidine kinase KinB
MDDNRRMIQDSARASLTLLYNISRELASISDLRTMLARVLSLSVHTVGAERGSLIVLDSSGNPVDAALEYKGQLQPETVEQLRTTLQHGLAGWVYRHRQMVLLNDTSRDSRWLRRPDDATEQSGAKSAVCVPLMAREQLVGVLTIVHPHPNFFGTEHLELIQAIADQAGIAIRNAQLYDSLNEASRRYYELFEDSVDPIFITDWDGNILEANRQAENATGYGIEELKQLSALKLFEPRWDKLGKNLENSQSGQPISYETSLQTKSGASIPVEVHIRKINFEARQNLQWIAQDISERRNLEALQEDLSSMIYHDLRSPLSNVFSSLEMLEVLLPEDGNPALTSVLRIAMRSTERVQRLINTLLDIRRLEAGQPITSRRWVDLRKLFEEVYEHIQPVIDTKRQQIELELEPTYPALWLDADMMRRVLANLLENASKFTPLQGQLFAGARLEGDSVLCWVRDTGAGIPSEAYDKIFDKFTSLQSDNMPRGLGLGLAFCRLAVIAHGGKIWVESEIGKGSTFYFTLPVHQT